MPPPRGSSGRAREMADIARCICPQEPKGGRHKECPIHGDAHKDPLKPYVLTTTDRELLKTFRIDDERPE